MQNESKCYRQAGFDSYPLSIMQSYEEINRTKMFQAVSEFAEFDTFFDTAPLRGFR
jgi:hypothetical protein